MGLCRHIGAMDPHKVLQGRAMPVILIVRKLRHWIDKRHDSGVRAGTWSQGSLSATLQTLEKGLKFIPLSPYQRVLLSDCTPTVSGLSTGPCTCLLTTRLKKQTKNPKHFQWMPIIHYVRDDATFNVSQKTLQPVTETDWSITQLLYQRHFQHVTYRNLTKIFHFQFTKINKNFQTIESKMISSKSPWVLTEGDTLPNSPRRAHLLHQPASL